MAKGKTKGKGEATMARAWAKTAGGNVKALFVISPAQEKALREEAFKRAMAVGSAKPDASAVLREVLEEWLRKRGR